MSIENLTSLVTIILAISLASERLVTIIKTLLPEYLADEEKTDAQEVDLVKDKRRRFIVQLLAFFAAWCTTSFLVDGTFEPLGYLEVAGQKFHVALLALLASGGSAFWNNILGYTKAIKDIKVQQRANESLMYHNRARALGKHPIDGGMVARTSSNRANIKE